MTNPYDRYVSDNPSSPGKTPSRRRISFSRKAAPVVSITATSATSTGQDENNPISCIPFPSTPPTPACHDDDAVYISFPGDLLSAPDPTERTQPACPHRRQRSNSGLIPTQHSNPRPLATLNSDSSRATVGSIDLGKSTAALSITSSGDVSRASNDYLTRSLATAYQRRLQQDRKRNPSMVTKKQTKKASIDAKFLITLHHSITWHIENRSDAKGQPPLPQDPDPQGILTIGKSPSLRVTRARRLGRAPRSTNLPISSTKGPDPSSGPQTRSPCEWGPGVSGPRIRRARPQPAFPLSVTRSRPGYHDDATDRRCASYEASGSSNEATSSEEPSGVESLDGVQEVALISALLMFSFRVAVYSSYPPHSCCLFHTRFTTPRLVPFTTLSNVLTHDSHTIHKTFPPPHVCTHIAFPLQFASYSPVDPVCFLVHPRFPPQIV